MKLIVTRDGHRQQRELSSEDEWAEPPQQFFGINLQHWNPHPQGTQNPAN